MPRNDAILPEMPPGKAKLAKSFFTKVRDRIETIRPIAGDGITVEAAEGYGLKISSTGGGSGSGAQIIALTVCKDGEPSTIWVLGYETDPLEADG